MNNSVNPLGYPAPNLTTMDAARAVIDAQVTVLKLEFLPGMKEKLLPLQRALTKADSVFRQELRSVLTLFDIAQLDEVERKRKEVEDEPRLDDQQRRQALGMIDTERARIIGQLSKTIRNSAEAIAQTADDVAQIDLELKDNHLRDSLQGQVDRLNVRFTDLQTKMGDIAADRRLLDETIKTFEKYNLVDTFKDLLPTAEQLQSLSTAAAAPELALAEIGIARLQKMLDGIGRALGYQDLISERDKLRARYNQALDESRQTEAETRTLAVQLDEVDTLGRVDRSKRDWAAEARKASKALTTFQQSYMTETAPKLSKQRTVELVAYINSFYSVERED